jgi:GLPGLI family protein
MKFIKFFLLLIPTIVFCQQTPQKNLSDILIKYNYESARDTTQVEKKNKEIMVLAINKNSSIYYSDKYLQALDLMKKKMDMALHSNTIVEINGKDFSMPKVRHSVFHKDNDILVSSQLGRDLFTFKTNILKWNTNFTDIKDILGYKCNKATVLFSGRLYTAWYAKEIPISEGPYRFKGLPGLILFIEDEKGFDKFEAVAIEKKQIEITQLQKGISITREEYIKKREEYKQNPFPEKNLTPQQRNQIIENQKRANNTLERY